MKALSIKQPWASLIAHGIKDIENRTWRTHFRGRIYIHASAPKKFNIQLTDEQTKLAVPVLETAFKGTMSFGAIIGEVEIIDCVINHESIWAEKTPIIYTKPLIKDSNLRGYKEALKMYNENKPIYNWVLANPVLYDQPILNVKGKLSFWEPNPNQNCMNCEEKFFGQDPQYCCNGSMCGCLGYPTEPVVCSEKCYDELVNKHK
jgi:hypothetical protein